MIEGIKITPLKQIEDERGKVMHMLRNDSKSFTKMTLNYAVVFGEIKLVLYDVRPNSKTKGQLQEFFLSQKNYKLISVPPLIWNGFMGIGNKTAIVANCADLPYDDTEIKRKSSLDKEIPYDWNKNITNKLFD